MKKATVVSLAFCSLAVVSSAEIASWTDAQKNVIVYDVNGSGGWNDASRWVGGKVPGPENAVKIEFATDVTITDADLNVFTNVYWYTLINSHITFDCSVDVDYPGCFRSGSRTSFVKVGGNTLTFSHQKDEYCNYTITDFIISNGCVRFGKMYQYSQLSPLIEVWKPGVAELRSSGNTELLGIVGDGIVTNAVSGGTRGLRLWSRNTLGALGYGPWTFSGTIADSVAIVIGEEDTKDYSWGEQYFTGTSHIRSSTAGQPQIFHGFIGVEEPGFGEGSAASIRGNTYHFYGSKMNANPDVGFRYLGRGGITDMRINYYNKYGCSPLTIDAGAHGGLMFVDGEEEEAGYWSNLADKFYKKAVGSTDVTAERFILAGSNTATCVISNTIKDSTSAPYICFIKRGTGTWRFAERPVEMCQNKGPVLVEQGRLEFDSFAALGTATVSCTNFWEGVGDELCKVPYIYRLGDGSCDPDADDLPTMAYLGAEKAMTDRGFAVCGAGRIENGPGAGGLDLAGGVVSDSEGENALVLAGAGVNRLANATNGIGTLCVIKEDAGEWTLAGEVGISGAEVRAGTLKLVGSYECPRLKVDGGASFMAEASGLAVSRLKFDALCGAGSIKGVEFSEEGDFDLIGAEMGFSVIDLGGDFAGSRGLDNLPKWTLRINGAIASKYVASIASGKLKIRRRGTTVVLR